MKKVRFYMCDGGCLLIGNGSSRFSIPNGYGDGKHRVIVTDEKEEVQKAKKYYGEHMEWLGVVEGDAVNIYNYDCYRANELSENVLFTIHGEFDVYSAVGTMYLVKRPTR